MGSTDTKDTLGCLTGGNCTAMERMDSRIPGVLAQPVYGSVMCGCIVVVALVCRRFATALPGGEIDSKKLKKS